MIETTDFFWAVLGFAVYLAGGAFTFARVRGNGVTFDALDLVIDFLVALLWPLSWAIGGALMVPSWFRRMRRRLGRAW